MEKALVVGLGNPGKAYEKSRHNIGFQVIDEIARQFGLTLRKRVLLRGCFTQAHIQDIELFLLKPSTYMNLSGEAISKVLFKFGVSVENLLVIVDDIALPFGQLRLKSHGSPGGHNGLKSVEECLQTRTYTRLRVGIGDQREADLASYVLAAFTPEERQLVPEILERATLIVKIWLTEGLASAMNHANIRL
jgi:PTH1 family peptidyl-tRNA hydrolase